jgi:signal transduction histidine kinase
VTGVQTCALPICARLTIADDGAGFDPAAPAPGHFGVAGMRERAALAGAKLEIDSAPGRGARIVLDAP